MPFVLTFCWCCCHQRITIKIGFSVMWTGSYTENMILYHIGQRLVIIYVKISFQSAPAWIRLSLPCFFIIPIIIIFYHFAFSQRLSTLQLINQLLSFVLRTLYLVFAPLEGPDFVLIEVTPRCLFTSLKSIAGAYQISKHMGEKMMKLDSLLVAQKRHTRARYFFVS